jgi:hypothetical protein
MSTHLFFGSAPFEHPTRPQHTPDLSPDQYCCPTTISLLKLGITRTPHRQSPSRLPLKRCIRCAPSITSFMHERAQYSPTSFLSSSSLLIASCRLFTTRTFRRYVGEVVSESAASATTFVATMFRTANFHHIPQTRVLDPFSMQTLSLLNCPSWSYAW